jgi:hypothetical protein
MHGRRHGRRVEVRATCGPLVDSGTLAAIDIEQVNALWADARILISETRDRIKALQARSRSRWTAG